jgi:hypothetical protein
MTCYKLKLNLRRAGFGLAHEWRKSLELNLRHSTVLALKGYGAGAKRRAIAPPAWRRDGASRAITLYGPNPKTRRLLAQWRGPLN